MKYLLGLCLCHQLVVLSGAERRKTDVLQESLLQVQDEEEDDREHKSSFLEPSLPAATTTEKEPTGESLAEVQAAEAAEIARLQAQLARQEQFEDVGHVQTMSVAAKRRQKRREARQAQSRGFPFGLFGGGDPTGCPAGTHSRMKNRFEVDPHPPGVNPNCRAWDDDYKCEEEQLNWVASQDIDFGSSLTAECKDVIRWPSIWAQEPEKELIWEYDSSMARDDIYGYVTLECTEVRGKGVVIVLSHNCRELLPFSVVNAFDPSSKPRKTLWWEERTASGPWSSKEIKIFDCGTLPQTIVTKTTTCSGEYGDILIVASKACAADPTCKAVAIPKQGGSYSLLSTFYCPFGGKDGEIKQGEIVKWRGWTAEAPSTETGIVLTGWSLHSKKELVQVKFQDRKDLVRVHNSNLERLNSKAPMTVVYPLRERRVVCEKMREGKSCDVPTRNDAFVLFTDKRKTVDDCQMACKEKADTSRFSVGFKGCCAFSAGICSISQGELFQLVESSYDYDWDDEPRFSQKRKLEEPDVPELAGHCYELPCAMDPLCTFDAKSDFEPPTDLPLEPTSDSAVAYFDFAHPLSMPFAYAPGEDRVNFFHVTSEQPALLKNLQADKRRLLRKVGLIPKSAAVLKKLPEGREVNASDFSWQQQKGKTKKKGDAYEPRSIKTRASLDDDLEYLGNTEEDKDTDTEESLELWEDVHKFDYPGGSGRSPPETWDHLEEQLDVVCEQFAKAFGRDIVAPVISLQDRDDCFRKHGTHTSPGFEPCLVHKGCTHNDAEARFVPFHSPWVSKLQFDILASQQPAPFCCVTPYNDDLRDEEMLRNFFTDIDFQDPSKVDLSQVTDQGAKETMSDSLHDGAKAMKKLLSHDVKDESTLNWLAGFLEHSTLVLSKWVDELQDTVDSEGEEVEVSSSGTSFLVLHPEGPHTSSSGNKGFELARWSEQRGAFIQVGLREPDGTPAGSNSTIGKLWKIAKSVPGAIYSYGIKPVWNHLMKPLARWGFTIAKWVIEHPRSALFISKIALAIRDRLCEKASFQIYEQPDAQAIGAFSAMSDKVSEASKYFKDTFTPATLLITLQNSLANTRFADTMKSMGSAAFGVVMAWAGVATGGAATALIGSVTGLLADAAIDASKQALELMIYKEIAKEIPSNLFDFFMKKCIYKREPEREITFAATAEEVAGAARDTLSAVTQQVTAQSSRLLNAMSSFAGWFGGSGSLLELEGNLTNLTASQMRKVLLSKQKLMKHKRFVDVRPEM